MAYLLNLETGVLSPLVAHHTLGALEAKVDTLIDKPYVSRLHAVIEWIGDHWQIKDFSRNGTWINKTALTIGVPQKLKLHDVIHFADRSGAGYQVTDLSAPRDLLLPMSYTNKMNFATEMDASPVLLERYNLLPDERNPEIAVYLDDHLGHWWMESTNDNAAGTLKLDHRDILGFAGTQWQLFCAQSCQHTEELGTTIRGLKDYVLEFDLAPDEETTHLKLRDDKTTVDLTVRSHHYLLLQLARHKARDSISGLDRSVQGWVYSEQLASELGLDISHLNIQIFRARKQLSDALPNIDGQDSLIERRGGRIRLGPEKFVISKGGKVEHGLTG